MKKKEHDLFISHASEDKDDFVRPLVKLLQKFGLDIWYDEFTLEVGDSLSKSIDKGLATSNYGLVVISPHFLEKNWPDYELRGLITREVDGEKVILPIWHNITKKEVVEFSPSLADKVALRTGDDSLNKIALSVLKVVRPDVFKNFRRKMEWKEKIKNAERKSISPEELDLGEIKHKSLPETLLLRIRIIHQILKDVKDQTLEESIDLFKRDLQPQDEIHVWERIASTFLEITSGENLDKDRKQEIFLFILGLTTVSPDQLVEKFKDSFDPEQMKYMIEVFGKIIPSDEYT